MNLSRRQLYDLVWSKPILSLAKEYGFSDVGFSKICRRHSIPLPPRGYWAKVSAGFKVSQPPLPNPHREGPVYIPPRKSITDEDILQKKKLLAQEKSEVETIGVIAAEARFGRSWTDGKRLIELELPSIIHEFISLVPRQKQARIDELARQELRKEETRIFKERESRRYLEQSIYKEALQESELFKLHKQLESYLNSLEVQYLEKYGIFNEQALAWISTARKIANANNPVSRRLKILGNGLL